ncbi:MAG TPA: hypothetical protein VFV79_06170 [Saprospiraceae bacterium]|nr:hypothetical protein [Saprospiraceae bacterium]
MKKILFSFSLLLCFAFAAQAQHACCSKSADKGGKSSCEVKVASASTPIPSEYQTAAAKVASLDATIEPRTNPVTGEVTYVRKETSTHNGEVSFVALNFDPATSTFVNVSPTQVAAKENTQSCGSSAKSASASKSCCAGATKASCGDKAKTSTASATTSPAPATATKTSGGSKD